MKKVYFAEAEMTGCVIIHSFGQAVILMTHYHVLGTIQGLQVPRHGPCPWVCDIVWCGAKSKQKMTAVLSE